MGRKTPYNVMVTPESWEKVSQENKLLLQDFIEYKRSSDKSPTTLYQYESVTKIFLVWNAEYNDNKFFVDMKKREFIRFFNYLISELHSSPNRIIMIRATLSSLSNYIEDILDEEYPNFRNIVLRIETVAKEPVRKKTIMSTQQVEDCLKKLMDDKQYQAACFFALATASGARKSELLRFKCDYFKDENIVFECMYKTPEEIKTKGRGSRGKMLYKYIFVKQFKPYFDAWMKFREENGIECEALFVNKGRNGKYKQADVAFVNTLVKAIEERLGLPFYAHACRHYFITKLRTSGLPDKIIQKITGFASTEIINVYDDSDVEDEFGDYFDKDGIRSDIKKARLSDV